MQNFLILAGILCAVFCGGSSFSSSSEDDDWAASEMNKEGMNYKD